MDINAALEAYSHAGGNRLESLRERCLRTSYEGSVELLAERIERMQKALFDIVWARSERGGLTVQEIEQIARAHLARTEPEIDGTGLQALMRWLGWMAWHEGCLRE